MKVQLILMMATLAGMGFSAAAKTAIHGDISRVADTAHLEFEGLKNWNYQIERPEKDKVILTIPAFDAATEAKLNSFSDPLVKSVTVEKSGPDDTYQIEFKLANPNVDSFDYLTDDPSRLIIDFYKKAPVQRPVVREKPEEAGKAAERTESRTSSKPVLHARKPIVKNRQPAGDEVLQAEEKDNDDTLANGEEGPVDTHFGAFDASDSNFDRFRVKDYEIREEAILASTRNIYLEFPMLKMPVSRLDRLIADQPEYVIHEKPDRENKEARLLALLFQRHRNSMFIKTFFYFEKKYPDSDYLEILRNMAGHIYLTQWKAGGSNDDYDRARNTYVSLIRRYPDSSLYERNYLILGYMQLERGEALATLQHFQDYIAKFPNSTEVPQAKKAIAEAFLLLHKYDDSLGVYSSMAKEYTKTSDGPEARYRMGDVEFARGNWPAAIRTFTQVIKELPQYKKTFPNAHFNKAEALFWNKDYKASLDEYVNFLSLFPTHPYGGYAMTRIGELMGVLGVDMRRAMGAFLESTFRYPENPGAKVARLRMLTQQMKNMRPKDLKKALNEIKNSITEVHLPGMEEFSTLLLANGLLDRGE